LGYGSVTVLGHPEYYPKFVLKPAGTWNIRNPFGVPAEAFMGLELKDGALEGASGMEEYPEEFNGL
jgi:predicted N-acetyltransferase YhbS